LIRPAQPVGDGAGVVPYSRESRLYSYL